MNRLETALPAPYHCTSCGNILRWQGDIVSVDSVQSSWICDCGERFNIIQLTDEELESQWSENDGNGLTRSETKLSQDTFIKAVLEVFGIDFNLVLARKRSREPVMAREIIAYYLLNIRGISITRVGEMLGKRATATAYHLIRLYEHDSLYDKNFKKYLREVLRITGRESL